MDHGVHGLHSWGSHSHGPQWVDGACIRVHDPWVCMHVRAGHGGSYATVELGAERQAAAPGQTLVKRAIEQQRCSSQGSLQRGPVPDCSMGLRTAAACLRQGLMQLHDGHTQRGWLCVGQHSTREAAHACWSACRREQQALALSHKSIPVKVSVPGAA